MGTGSVPPSTINSTYHWSANALWVILGFGDRPATPEWIAWPPEGYVPHPVVYARWSFSYPDADFSTAKVTMSRSGAPVSLAVLALDRNDMGYADNTIVWEPSGLPTAPPAADITYTVTVSDVVVEETPRTFRYDVTIIDPDKPSPTIGVTDIKTLPGNTISITFVNTGTDASAYLLEKATGLSVTGNWSTDTNAQITDLGAGVLEARTTCPPAERARFYRVKLVE